MKRNITLKIDEDLIRTGRHQAIEQNKSLSTWVANLIINEIRKKGSFSLAKKHAEKVLEEGLDLGGNPMHRDEVHDR